MSVSCHASAPEREGPCLQQEEASGSFPFFFLIRAVLCYAVLSLVVAVVRVGPWISNHLTQRRRVPKLPKTA